MDSPNKLLSENIAYSIGLAIVGSIALMALGIAVANLVNLVQYKLIDTGPKILLGMGIASEIFAMARCGIEFAIYFILIVTNNFSLAEIHDVRACQIAAGIISIPSIVLVVSTVPLAYSQWRQMRRMDSTHDTSMTTKSVVGAIAYALVCVSMTTGVPVKEKTLPMCDVLLTVKPYVGIVSTIVNLAVQAIALGLAMKSKVYSRQHLKAYESRTKDLSVSQRVLIERNSKLFKAIYPGIIGQIVGFVCGMIMYIAIAIIVSSHTITLTRRSVLNMYFIYGPYTAGNLAMSIFLRRIFRAEPVVRAGANMEDEQGYRLAQLSQMWSTAAHKQRIVTTAT